MSEERRPRWSSTLWFLTTFSVLMALMDGSFVIAGLALFVALAIGVHAVARVLLLSERKDQF
jgi:hypothetical protein